MGDYVKYIDISSYCEMMSNSIQKSIDSGNYDSVHLQLCVYLLEVHARYISGEINVNSWRETMRFYRRMTTAVIEESNQYTKN